MALQLAVLLAGVVAMDGAQWAIHSDGAADEVARLVKELLPREQQEIERRLGLALRGRGSVVLCGSTGAFRKATPGIDHRHTLGVAFPLETIICLNCEEIEKGPLESVIITLRHELSHILVGEVARRGHRHVPLWFDEGVAVWSSGKLPFYDTSEYERAVAGGSLFPLADLAERFPLDPRDRGIAYEQSESFVRFLVKRRGEAVVPAILRGAARGVEFGDAFRDAVGADLAVAEQEWLRAIRPWVPWLNWTLRAVSLFGAMSVLAVFSFWVYLRRRRRKYQEWEMEERLSAGEGNPWH